LQQHRSMRLIRQDRTVTPRLQQLRRLHHSVPVPSRTTAAMPVFAVVVIHPILNRPQMQIRDGFHGAENKKVVVHVNEPVGHVRVGASSEQVGGRVLILRFVLPQRQVFDVHYPLRFVPSDPHGAVRNVPERPEGVAKLFVVAVRAHHVHDVRFHSLAPSSRIADTAGGTLYLRESGGFPIRFRRPDKRTLGTGCPTSCGQCESDDGWYGSPVPLSPSGRSSPGVSRPAPPERDRAGTAFAATSDP